MGDDLYLRIMLQAEDLASKYVKDVGTALDGLGKNAGGMGSAIDKATSSTNPFMGALSAVGNVALQVGQVALHAVGEGIQFFGNQLEDSVQIAEKHQEVMAQTQAAIKSTGDASGFSAKQVEDMATSLSKVTKFSEDTVQGGENLLLTFTGIGKKTFPAATQAMLDMSQAMGQDIKSSAIQLGKALNDPLKGLTALQRVGVAFTDQEKEQIKVMMAHGDVAGAQAVMLKELQTEFGGSAQAAGKTFAGSLQILKNTLEDTKQQIGTALLPVLQSFISNISSIAIPVLTRFGDWFTNSAGPALQGFADNVNKAFTYVGNIFKSLPISELTDAWQSLKSSVVDLGQAFQVLGARLHPVMVDFDPLAEAIQRLAQGGLNILTGMIWKAYVAISALDGIFLGGKGPLENFGNAFRSLGPPIQTIATMLSGQFSETLKFVGTSFKAVGDWIKTSVAPALQSAMPGFMQLGAALLNIVPFLLQVREVGMQLVEGFLTHVAPVIGFIIPPVIALAGFLAGVLAGAINVVVTVGSAILTFFTKTQIGGDLLKATLIALAIPVGILGLAFTALAIEAIAGFVMAIPGMITGFLAGAAGAWSMAAGVLALTWPILAVIGVIALIILAVQHWSDIVGVLKTTWSGIATFFTGLWAGILSGLKAAWNAIVNVIKIGAIVALAVLFAPFVAIGALFIWLYNHNTYFKALVDKIVSVFQYCIGWISHAWQEVIHWLNDKWNELLKFASDLWTKVSSSIHDGFTAAIGFIVSVWTTISGVFSSAWNNYIAKPLTDMWNSVSKFFSSVYNAYIAGPIGALWTSITTTIGGWVTSAVDWGGNLIQGFVNGIVAKASNVASAVGGIAAKVLAFLGFHSPTKEGPGQEADVWAPNLVKMYSSGIEAGIPQIQNSLNKLTKPIAMSLGVTGNAGVTNAIGNVNLKGGLVPSASSTPLQGGSTTNNSGGTVNNTFNININVPQGRLDRAGARELAKVVRDELSRELRGGGRLTTWTSGGAI